MAKWVDLFKEGDASMRNLLGGKGANLAEIKLLSWLQGMGAGEWVLPLVYCGVAWEMVKCPPHLLPLSLTAGVRLLGPKVMREGVQTPSFTSCSSLETRS